MGRRRQKRVTAIIPVRMWGVDQNSTRFNEHICTFDISKGGVRLMGVRASLAVGDTVTVQHRNRQARYRVSWIDSNASAGQMQVGLDCLEPEKDIWQTPLPGDEPDRFNLANVPPRKY